MFIPEFVIATILLTTTMPSQNSSSHETNQAVCHSLPCSIDYSGRAPVSSFFQPVPLSDPKNVQAATLRGRGLLARHPAIPVHGRVVTTSTRNDTNVKLVKTKERFDGYSEWKHAHQPDALWTRESRIETAQEWMQLAAAIHAPIPVGEIGEKDTA